MKWNLFSEELPELGKLILYGNHRFVDTALYNPEHPRIKSGKMHFKDITHWCYIESPPEVKTESKWSDK